MRYGIVSVLLGCVVTTFIWPVTTNTDIRLVVSAILLVFILLFRKNLQSPERSEQWKRNVDRIVWLILGTAALCLLALWFVTCA